MQMVKQGIAMLIALAAGHAQTGKPLEFDIASVKPAAPGLPGTMVEFQPGGGLKVKNATFKMLVTMAYELREFQVSGGPGWISTDRFDVDAKSEAVGPVPDFRKMTDEQRKEMQQQMFERVRSLLAERFHFAAHQETKEMPIYYLVQAKGGSKLKQVEEEPTGNRGMRMQRGTLTGMFATIDMLAGTLAGTVGRPVIDKTGLTGKYDWKLEWTPEPPPAQPSGSPGGPAPEQAATLPDLSGPSLFTALQEQLGLKLEAQRGPAPILIIDRVEKPSAN